MLTPRDIFAVPSRNYFYVSQNNEINGFDIEDHEKKPVYYAIGKTVTTRSHYRISRKIDGVAIASVEQGQNDKKYTITDETGTKLAEIRIVDSDTVTMKIGERTYTSKVINRGKQFEFKDDKDKLVLTVDKKLLTFSDKYKVAFIEDFPALIAATISIVLDDFYHLGPTN